jgi:hypothetical protein
MDQLVVMNMHELLECVQIADLSFLVVWESSFLQVSITTKVASSYIVPQ